MYETEAARSGKEGGIAMINVENYRATRQAADPHGHAVVTGLVGAAILAVGVYREELAGWVNAAN